ncbi:vWA domain-containing protein [Bombella apis]|uniref:vWA domain-containing protein n=1 Tax=Bombella apis TaxID=1785988 RepID=UPI0009DB1205|nr:vWA domain-containing protein [Bombella apis]MPV99045.1 VWA domain-containing protein [Bombella apis]
MTPTFLSASTLFSFSSKKARIITRLMGSTLCGIIALTGQHGFAAPLLQRAGGTLYQQILTQPGAIITPDEHTEQGTPSPGFLAYYVFARANDKLQIGSTKDHPNGWIKASQTLSWNHRLNAQFAPLAGRSRAIFMSTRQAEENLLNGNDPAADARAILSAGDHQPPNSQAAALEPDAWIDQKKHFYLLPILDAHNSEPDYTGAMLMHVAGATLPPPHEQKSDAAPPFRAGLVFVIDTTQSMQPYIEQTRNAINDIVSQINNAPLGHNFRFGLVGFRDQSRKDDPRLEYASKIFATPDFTQSSDAITSQIASVNEAHVSSFGFDEDPIAGLKTAITDIDWSSMQGRYIILVTDAGARDEHNPLSSTHLGITDLNRLAEKHDIALFVIHLHTPAGKKFNDTDRAEAQYRTLSAFPNTSSLYYPVGNGTSDNLTNDFNLVVRQLTQAILTQASHISGQHGSQTTPEGPSNDRMAIVEQAMRLRYIGQRDNASLPPMIEGYVASTDPVSNKTALRVNLLMKRNEMNNLASSLETILDQGEQSQLAPEQFFQRLQFAFAASARNPDALSHDGDAAHGTLGSLLPEYLNGLPYRSRIAQLTQERWNSLSAGEQDAILSDLRALIERYKLYESDTDGWHSINGGNDEDEKVYSVGLDDLP